MSCLPIPSDRHYFMSMRYCCCCSIAQLCKTLQTHRLQQTRLSCLSPCPRTFSNSSALSWWCHPASHFRLPPFFPISGSFPMSQLCMMWPKYCSFSICPSNEYTALISFRIDWFDLLAVQGTLKSLLQHHSMPSLVFSFLYGPTLTSVQDYWKQTNNNKKKNQLLQYVFSLAKGYFCF